MLSFLVYSALVATAISAVDICGKDGDEVDCLKQQTVQFLDQVSEERSIPLYGGLSLSRDSSALAPVIDNRRRRKHKKKFMGLAMAAAAAAAAITGPLFFAGLAAIAFKALVAAKAALTLAAISGLKMLSHHHDYSHRSDIHLPGQQHHHNSGGHQDAHHMAYGGQMHGHNGYEYA
ncbi:hypothetical protein C0J52_22910 [Blattella germanica]|nr:hypothetical protein C0J52_22910 [Blattella germanica]